jgi:hypothetical protein
VGGSDPQIRSLRALADSLGLGDTVLPTGRVAKSTVALAAGGQRAGLAPPAWLNTPLKIYEQIASGRTLVATRVDRIRRFSMRPFAAWSIPILPRSPVACSRF